MKWLLRFSLLLLSFLLTTCYAAHGQLNVSVVDSASKKPLIGVSITVFAEGKLVDFCVSGNDGFCRLPNRDSVVFKLTIKADALGYAPQQIFVSNALQQKNTIFFYLVAVPVPLQAVTVRGKRRRIFTANGDTLSFNVKELTTPLDQSIEDVLKRLPGIRVLDNGQVLYNDQPIAGFTIGHDDVLGKQYTLASKNIKPNMVDSIQILQNTQKINALNGIVGSTNNYVNLVLTAGAKVKPITNGDVGIGVPNLYEASANRLGLQDKKKSLVFAQANNSRVSNLERYQPPPLGGLEDVSVGVPTPNLFNFGTIPTPSLDPDLWQRNNSAAMQSNFFKRKSKFVTERFSLSLLRNEIKYSYGANTTIFFQQDTVKYTENGNAKSVQDLMSWGYQIEDNRARSYLLLKYEGFLSRSDLEGRLSQIGSLLSQTTKTPNQNHRLSFKNIKPLSPTSFLQINSVSFFDARTERNQINFTPSLHIPAIEDSNLSQIRQVAKVNSFATQNDFSYNWYGAIHLYSKFDVLYRQNVGDISHFNKASYNNVESLSGLLSGKSSMDYWRTAISIGCNKIMERFEFGLQLGYQNVPAISNTSGATAITGGNFNRQMFYTFSGRKRISKEHALSISSSYAPAVQANDLFPFFPVLSTYRDAVVNAPFFPIENALSNRVQFSFRKSIKLLFVNVGVSHRLFKKNGIANSENSNQFSTANFFEFNNNKHVLGASIGVTKYLFSAQLQTKCFVDFNRNYSQIFQGGKLVDLLGNGSNYLFEVSKKIASTFNIEISYGVSRNVSSATLNREGQLLAENTFLQQNGSAKLSGLVGRFRYTLIWNLGSSAVNRQPNLNFNLLNADFEYKFSKLPFPFYLSATNLLNKRAFIQQSGDLQFQYLATYPLRPLQLILGCKWQL